MATTPSLRRLINEEIKQLLDTTAVGVGDLCLAVIELDGTVVYQCGACPSDLDHSFGVARRDIAPRGEVLGWLAWEGLAPTAVVGTLERSLSLLLASALDKHDLARETLERYREINLLYRASETIGSCLNVSSVPELLLSEAQRAIASAVGAVVLNGAIGGGATATRGPEDSVSALLDTAGGLVGRVIESGKSDMRVWDEGAVSSALSVPIRAGEDVLGAVVLGRTDGSRSFTASDEKLLLGLAGQAGVALERAEMHERETGRQRMLEEINVARRIQLSLLPSRLPDVSGWSFAAAYSSARQVGGDFYDFFEKALGERRLSMVIADVTGKGVPAALMMAYSRALFRAESMVGHPPWEVLDHTNQLVMQDRHTRPFLTAVYATFELDSGRMIYASAGHEPPLLIPADRSGVRVLDAPGVLLGAFDNIVLEERSVTLEPGDTVFFYTDGVTEARTRDREMFGEDRLFSVLRESRGRAEAVLSSVTKAIEKFTAGAVQYDDVTIVVVQRDERDG